MRLGKWAVVWFLALLGCGKTQVPDQLVNLRCSESGDFATGYSWNLVAGADGRATLTVFTPKGDKVRDLQIAKGKLTSLQHAIEKYHFFEIPANIGVSVPDGSTRVVDIETTGRSKKINIRFVGHEQLGGDAENALGLWDAVRDCFDDDDAVDSRPYDKKVLRQPR